MADPPATDDAALTVLRLAPAEVEILRSALRMLRNVLGRDEADELAAVQALLDRLESNRRPDASKTPGS